MRIVHSATGHRPDKLGGYNLAARRRLDSLAFTHFEARPPEAFISGMALGWDMSCAYVCIKLGIPVIAAVPFKGQELRWSIAAQSLYNDILARSESVEYVCSDGYASWKMQRRNEWMVDNSVKVIALWDGSSGGTANCIAYATKRKRPIKNLWPLWLQIN